MATVVVEGTGADADAGAAARLGILGGTRATKSLGRAEVALGELEIPLESVMHHADVSINNVYRIVSVQPGA